jgi:hypothetical protein
MENKTKMCSRCGKMFYPSKYYPAQRFCSSNCQISEWRKRNSDYCELQNKQYYTINREKIIKRNHLWYEDNKDKLWVARRERYRKHREGLLNNKEKDVLFYLRMALRRRLNDAIKKNTKSGSAVRDLGCSILALKKHLESKFQSGMSWSNYGRWHIDHIIPLAFFDLTDREQLLKACHYTNLRPLWANENCSKGYEISRNSAMKSTSV